MQRFLTLGLPTLRDESWRYTNLRPLSAQSFVDAPRAPAGTVRPSASLSLLGEEARVATVLMVNGIPVLPERMDLSINGIEISSLRELSRTDIKLVSRFLEPLSEAEEARWRLLNTALFVDGLYLRVRTRVQTPLIILHVATAESPGTAAYPRVIIEASPSSSATIIEHHVQQGPETPLLNSAALIALEHDAQLEHYRVFATDQKTTHLDSLEVRQEKDSRCRQFTISLGGGLVRSSIEAHLEERGARIDCYSLLVGHEERHVDCVNMVRHGAPDTVSRQTARAIASGTSRVIFNSKVVVDAGAVAGRLAAIVPRPSALAVRGDRLAAPARDPHRRGQVRARREHRTARSQHALLHALAGPGPRHRAEPADLRVPRGRAHRHVGDAARAAIENALISQLPDSQVLQKFR